LVRHLSFDSKEREPRGLWLVAHEVYS
jgi:hypothetical protein